MTGRSSPFDHRVVIALVLVGALSFGIMIYFSVFGTRTSVSADSYSRSALGHFAFVEALRETDLDILVSQHRSDAKALPGSLVLMAEPSVGQPWAKTLYKDLEPRLHRGANLLLVLPKRIGEALDENDSWIGWQGLLPADRVSATLPPRLGLPSILRVGQVNQWRVNEFAFEPILPQPQLLAPDPGITPVIAAAGGILLGYKQISSAGRVWILSDPDLIANHGIDDGDNAALVAAIIGQIAGEGGRVVVDETIHGYHFTPSLWRQLFELPLLMVTLPVLLLMMLVCWMAGCRFGAPVPPPPALEPGKTGLIANTAELMLFGGHGAVVLQRYCHFTRQEVAARLHAPRHLGGLALENWMARVEVHRGVSHTAGSIAEEIDRACRSGGDASQLTHLAMKIHRWKEEMLNGT